MVTARGSPVVQNAKSNPKLKMSKLILKGPKLNLAAKARTVNSNPSFGSAMHATPDSKWSGTKPKQSSK